ncbi:MAG: hypothetical protein ACTSPE_13075 [Candidatus Thorarchaeota archaeon]
MVSRRLTILQELARTRTRHFRYVFFEWLRHDRWLLTLGVAITLAASIHYYVTMLHWTEPGFALDDSWIHVQYARTIFEGRPWQYSPGHPSTGSTSPLWSLILSPVFVLGYARYTVVNAVITIAVFFYSVSTYLVGKIIYSKTERPIASILGMMGYVIVPKNSWLMLSGMELPVLMTILLLSAHLFSDGKDRDPRLVGLLLGLAYLSRPEALVLVGVGVLAWLVHRDTTGKSPGRVLLDVVEIGMVGVLVAAPWVIHCITVTGYPLPDTFYAKVHPVTPGDVAAWDFWWHIFLTTMPMLTVGAIVGVVCAWKGQPYTWVYAIALAVLYRLTMPYQALINNTRYLVPVFDLLMITAVLGVSILFDHVPALQVSLPRGAKTNVATVIVIAFTLMMPLTEGYMYQADLYGNAVKNINEMQVYIGKWLKTHTPEDAIIATHDVGAIAYFSDRVIVDLAGLVSPDICHGNMTVLDNLRYLRAMNCTYFAFFDELFVIYAFYLEPGYQKILTVHLDDNVVCGRDTMSVYLINWTMVYLPE